MGFCVSLNGTQWYLMVEMVPNGTWWYPMVPMIPNDTRWYPMIPNDTRWYPMIPDGTQWSSVTQINPYIVGSQISDQIQWDQSSPGNMASILMIKLDFLAAWVVLDFPKTVSKIFFSWNLNYVWQNSIKTAVAHSLFIGSIRCIKWNVFRNCSYTFQIDRSYWKRGTADSSFLH